MYLNLVVLFISMQFGVNDVYPSQLKIFVGKEFLFQINIKKFNVNNGWLIYLVAKMTDDTSLIKQFKSGYSNNKMINFYHLIFKLSCLLDLYHNLT